MALPNEPAPEAPPVLYLSKLAVQDFGPLKSGELELGGFSLLLGPQNAGKTYLATLAYLFQRSAFQFLNLPIFNSLLEALRLAGLKGQVSAEGVRSTIRDRPAEFVRSVESMVETTMVHGLRNGLASHFLATSPGNLVRQGRPALGISGAFAAGPHEIAKFDLKVSRDGAVQAEVALNAEVVLEAIPQNTQITLMEGGGGSATNLPFSGASCHYIPVERLVLLPSFSQVTNLMLSIYRGLGEAGARPWPQPTSTPLLKQPVFDFLLEVNALLGTAKTYEIPGVGQIEVTNRTISFHDAKRDVTLPIAAAGSGVGQLTGLAIMCASPPGAMLIAEEPEINLHPDSQLLVADYLVRVANSHPMLVTTHSHFVLTKVALARSRGLLSHLAAQYIDPETETIERIDFDEATGDARLPRSIERAYESIAREAGALVRLD